MSFSLPTSSVLMSSGDEIEVGEGVGASDGAHPARNVEPMTPVMSPAL